MKSQKHRMYRIYLAQKVLYGFGLIMPAVLLGVVINMLYKRINYGYFEDGNWVMVIVFTALGIGFLVNLIPLMFGHFREIDKIRKTNPELVKEYEHEFEVSEDLGTEVYLSSKYCFIAAPKKFIVATPDKIKEIHTFVKYTKHGRWLKMDINAAGYNTTVQINEWVTDEDKDKAMTAAQKLVDFSNCKWVNDIK